MLGAVAGTYVPPIEIIIRPKIFISIFMSVTLTYSRSYLMLVFITSSWSSSSGTKPRPPHVGHCCSSSVPFSTTPSPLQFGQVFMCASWGCYPSPAIISAGASLIRLLRRVGDISALPPIADIVGLTQSFHQRGQVEATELLVQALLRSADLWPAQF